MLASLSKEFQAFLHNRRDKALHKAVCTMSVKTDIKRNKLMHLVMYGVYSEETLEKNYKNSTHIT